MFGLLQPRENGCQPQGGDRNCPERMSTHLKELYKSGQVIMDVGVDLEVKCLKRMNGKVEVTEGPFDKTNEMIGSVFIIEALDIKDAIRVVSLHPTTQLDAGEQFNWRIEIRPIHYFEKRE
ncbi:hypothetical protein HMPREF1013_04424 [Bacillus sp. 2_A_57_CT2]|nr:hypothetical protein HMPREF1013_04424 [Bacillus sp. 2_A_57_CT2]